MVAHNTGSLAPQHPSCEFHFVLGNHDSNRRFVAALERYAHSTPNLEVHPYFLRLDQKVFLHGDVADRPEICADKLRHRRSHWSGDERRGEVKNLLYDWAVKARLHKLCGKVVHPKQRVASRILGYLDRVGMGPESGIEDVYFGHTHEALANYQHRGISFHNGGAPIDGLDFRIVDVAGNKS